ncbi:MAG: hypothetical protein A2V69_00005 [Candidatus Portnoybacteria bacterium RBG_13_40_8]|uniref:Uncharacterized protein n=1 Tax=Candidatus Portnoybacteria bacterium RBG_13_40_8 TaxID=1801990 RepID=A0A1G2F271_9BACT|nr:MAG: hypothetical protein A2V69_00005 [Candidatus Portnoybacteria bacterium RBG_13_40_8]
MIVKKKKKRLVLVGIAGTQRDFLLSLPTLHCFLYNDKRIKDELDVIQKHYYYVPRKDLAKMSEKIAADVINLKPDFVGLSCYVWNIKCMLTVSDILRHKIRNVRIILGGPEITIAGILGGAFNNSGVDFLIFGEGEKPLAALMLNEISKSKRVLDEMKGVALRKGNHFICSPSFDIIENLVGEPSPYLKGFISDNILVEPGIRVNIETQRGCSFRCAYCFYHKNFPKVRYRSADVVVKELDYAFKKNIKMGRITDANFFSDKDFAKKILRGMINRRIKMALFLEVLPTFLDKELAQLIGEYIRISPDNRIMIGMGIQTLTQPSLERIRRRIPKNHFEKAFDLLQKEKVIIKSDIILGLPFEKKESYLETLEFITEKMHDGTNFLSLSLLRILPGTDLVQIAKEDRLVLDCRDENHFVYETPTMPRKEMLECLKLNAVATRLLTSLDDNNRMRIRDFYFETKDYLKLTNAQILWYFVKEFDSFLKKNKADSDYVKPDFPNAEDYYSRDIFVDIPDTWLIEKLSALKKFGLPTGYRNNSKTSYNK